MKAFQSGWDYKGRLQTFLSLPSFLKEFVFRRKTPTKEVFKSIHNQIFTYNSVSHFLFMFQVLIIDMKDVGISVLSQWTPALAKKVISSFEKGLPIRVKGAHILNTPVGFETAFAIFKAFLTDKLKKRVRISPRSNVMSHNVFIFCRLMLIDV